MLEVLRALYTFHQHIIHIHLHGVFDKVIEDLIYHPLKDGPDVLESEGHHLVAVNFPIVVKAILSSSGGCILI